MCQLAVGVAGVARETVISREAKVRRGRTAQGRGQGASDRARPAAEAPGSATTRYANVITNSAAAHTRCGERKHH